MVRRIALFFLLAVVPFLVTRTARADGGKVNVAVLSVESDDAEDQAEALSQALRSRLRASPGFQVVDVNQSVGTLMGVLRCNKVLDLACQGKIADQLKVDRMIWGRMQKSANHEVTVDLHLFAKGKGETPVKESYSDNLKDPNDDALRKVAQRILDRLMAKDPGSVTIKGNAAEVVIDGSRRMPLTNGAAKIDLTPGQHSLELSGKGLKPQKRDVTIVPGQEVPIAVTLASDAVVTPIITPTEPEQKSPTRKYIGYGVMGVGAAGVITGGIFGAIYLDKSGKQSGLNSKFPSDGGDACDYAAGNALGSGASKASAKEACDNSKAGEKAGLMGWIFAGAGTAVLVTGAIFAFTGGDSQEKPKAARVRVTPTFGYGSGGVAVLGSF